MMFSYPYFNFPYYRRYSRYGYGYPNSIYYPDNSNKTHTKNSKELNDVKHKQEKSYGNMKFTGFSTNDAPRQKNCNSTNKEEPPSIDEDSPVFQIFGINLYFDDILLVCLIFFLYQEGVKDESLFIALILLLLS